MRDEENDSRPGMAETPDASRTQSAALYVGGDQPAGAVEHAAPAEIDRQAHRLTGWARANGAVIPADFFNGLHRLEYTTAAAARPRKQILASFRAIS